MPATVDDGLRDINIDPISYLILPESLTVVRTRLSSKGQVILPKSVRDAHRWAAGTEFDVEETPDGVLLRPARPFGAATLDDIAGCLREAVEPRAIARTIEEMNEAIGAEIADRHDRGRY
jgi:AbrB family looped-hinge helix DNA binding protein